MNNLGHTVILHTLLFLSGWAGLGYEMLYTRMLSVGLGHEAAGVLAVVAAFFGGIALGALACHRPLLKTGAPLRWYAVLEIIVGLWALVLLLLIPWLNKALPLAVGSDPTWLRQWFVAFGGTFLLLLPATFAMGGTLPAMERVAARTGGTGRPVAGLYAANTFGAVLGTLVTTFVVIPEAGVTASLLFLAGINIFCAAAAWLLAHRYGAAAGAEPKSLRDGGSPARIYVALFVTGIAGVGYEVLVIRALSQVFESTVYSFASILSVYLLGTAAGATLYQRFGNRDNAGKISGLLIPATSAACLAGVIVSGQAQAVYTGVYMFTGGGLTGAVIAEIAVALAVFLLPTIAMGATFSHLAQEASLSTGGLGRALFWNTAGAALAPALFGVILLPPLGLSASLLVTSLGYLTVIPLLRPVSWPAIAAPACLAVITAFAQPPGHDLGTSAGDTVLTHVDGVMAAVSVVEDRRKERHLIVDRHFQMGGTSSRYSDLREGHIPLLLHPSPKRALFLGLGTGITFFAAAAHQGLEAEGIEIIPEMVPLMRHFVNLPGGHGAEGRLRVVTADARRYVLSAKGKYDVVVADLFHPARDGAGSLYTVEHFSAIRSILAQDGVFCQWLPLYQLDTDTLRVVVRTFLAVFPEASAFLAHYSIDSPILGLVSGPRNYTHDWFERRIRDEPLLAELKSIRIHDLYTMLGGYAGNGKALSAFAGSGPLNTDDRPIVTFEAPRFTYRSDASPSETLFRFMKAMAPRPDDILSEDLLDRSNVVSKRLSAYWKARDRFLEVGVSVRRSDDPLRLLDAVQGPLLEVIRISPDFTAAYNPLLSLAHRVHPLAPARAWRLLSDLEEANPGRTEARMLRASLFPGRRPD